MKKIGHSFAKELEAAGLLGLPFSWGEDGSFTFSDEMSQAQRDAVLAVYESHDPSAISPEIPQVVTRFQARAALHLAGLLASVEALMAAPETPALAKLAWADAQEFKRNSPTMLAMAAELGLTETQLDELFTVAAGIEA